MPTETPLWFNNEEYLQNKAAQLNGIQFEGRTNWTAAEAGAAMEAAGLTPYEHFVANGNAENVSPNDYFNVALYFTAKADQLTKANFDNKTWTPDDVAELFAQMHISAWDHYTNSGQFEGLNPSNHFDTNAYLLAKAAQLNEVRFNDKFDWSVQDVAKIFVDLDINPIEHYYLNGQDEGLTITPVPADQQVTAPEGFNPWAPGGGLPNPPVDAEPVYLTPELDVITGTDADELFIGQEFDGVNTLQTGDRIDGGGGHDTLYADVTGGNTFGTLLNAVRPQLKNIEVVKFSSQLSVDDHNGAMQVADIRADRIDSAMQELWSTESRAHLDVSDVRVNSTDMTIGFQNADAAHAMGNPNFEVHFNNQYLKAEGATHSGSIQLLLMDVDAAVANPNQPLLDNVATNVSFTYNGQKITLQFPEDSVVSGPDANYDTLLAAIRAAIAANPEAEGLTADFGPDFVAHQSQGSGEATGRTIIISTNNGTLSKVGSSWGTAEGGLPGDNNLFARVYDGDQNTTCPLIQTNIALDNAGMVAWNEINNCIPDDQQFGDYAGNVTVGGMGNGDYVGVQRFDVTVDRGSWISALESTNNALRMVVVKNGDLNGDKMTGTSTADKGNLFIGQGQRLSNDQTGDDSKAGYHIASGHYVFEGRDGLLGNTFGYAMNNGVGTYEGASAGLTDVMTFDASAMVGKANISAAITDKSSPKYFGDTDDVEGIGNQYSPATNFSYKFGSNDDTLNMVIDGNVAADNDFQMIINMGDGNNSVRTQFIQQGNNVNWIGNQHELKNVNITTGSGNDIVNPFGTGSSYVSVGAGNDIVYSDNSGINAGPLIGVGAVWVLNANNASQGNPYGVRVHNGEIVPLQNGISSHFTTFTGNATGQTSGNAEMKVEVTYKGVTGTATLNLAIAKDGSVSVTDSQVNQTIINAVNASNSWLSALMTAREGAGHSLLMISKVDGQALVNDLQINIKTTYGTGDNKTEFNLTANDGHADNVVLGNWYNGNDVAAGGHKQFAQVEYTYTNPGTGVTTTTYLDVTGNDSQAEADNFINLGAGKDLAVLSTGATSNETIILNETNNGDNTIVNFDLSDVAKGNDTIDARAILGEAKPDQVVGASVGGVVVDGLATTAGGVTSGTATNHNTAVVFVQNSTDAAKHIDNAAELATAIGNTPGVTYAEVLYMVYEGGATGAVTFHMYKATFGATNAAPTVTELSTLTFADFITGATGVAADQIGKLGEFFAGDVANMFDPANRLNNGPSASEPTQYVQVPDNAGTTADTFDATVAYQGNVAAFSTTTGVQQTQLTGTATTIQLQDAIKAADELRDYTKSGVTTIQLADVADNAVDFKDPSNSVYSWDGSKVAADKTINWTVEAAGKAANDTATPPTAATTLTGGQGVDNFDFKAAFEGVANGGKGDDVFKFEADQTKGTFDGGEGNDTILINGADLVLGSKDGAVFNNFETISFEGGQGSVDLTDYAQAITVDTTKAAGAVEITTSKAGVDTINLKGNEQTDTIILTAQDAPSATGNVTITGFKAGDILNVKDLGGTGTVKNATDETTLGAIDLTTGNVTFIDNATCTDFVGCKTLITSAQWTAGQLTTDAIFVMGTGTKFFVIDATAAANSTKIADTDIDLIGVVNTDGAITDADITV